MADQCECSMKLEFQHLKDDILDIKNTVKEDAKETTKEIMGMRDSKIRTEIALEAIIKTQETSAEDIAKVAKEAKENHDATLLVLDGIKNEKSNAWKNLSLIWKAAIIGAAASQIVGSIVGYVNLINK